MHHGFDNLKHPESSKDLLGTCAFKPSPNISSEGSPLKVVMESGNGPLAIRNFVLKSRFFRLQFRDPKFIENLIRQQHSFTNLSGLQE